MSSYHQAFPGGTHGKEPTSQRRRHKRCVFHPWVRKIPWRHPLWCFCLENPMDRGAWQATGHEVTESQARLKQFCTHPSTAITTLSSWTFSSPLKEALSPRTSHSLFTTTSPAPRPLATTHLPSVSMDLPTLEISSQWNHPVLTYSV